MRIILARCSAAYFGRVDTKLEIGDRVILIKDDGSILIQDSHKGIKPKNWMGPGTVLAQEGGGQVLIATNEKTGERLEIFIDLVNHDIGKDSAKV
jgi:RecB family endonuclease NucS